MIHEMEYEWKKAESRLKRAERRIRRKVELAQRDLESIETWGPGDAQAALREAERIEQYVLDELAACPDQRRIVLTTAGVAPPGCPAERFRAVGQWVKDVPVRMSDDQ